MANAPQAPKAPETPASAPAAAPAADEGYTFETVAVPAATRASALVNPFESAVKALAESMGEGGEKSAEAKVVRVPTTKAVKVKRQLSDAGKAAGVTVRSIPKEEGEHTLFTFWTVKRITHSR